MEALGLSENPGFRDSNPLSASGEGGSGAGEEIALSEATKWHLYSYGAMLGNYMLMMFYTTVGGWMLAYFFKIASGTFTGLDTEAVGNVFNTMLSNPGEMTFWMVIVTAFGFGTCCMGLQKGVERITKVMMVCLLTIMVVLCVKSCTLPGAIEGIKFYLLPDFGRLKENGLLSGIYAAMGLLHLFTHHKKYLVKEFH